MAFLEYLPTCASRPGVHGTRQGVACATSQEVTVDNHQGRWETRNPNLNVPLLHTITHSPSTRGAVSNPEVAALYKLSVQNIFQCKLKACSQSGPPYPLPSPTSSAVPSCLKGLVIPLTSPRSLLFELLTEKSLGSHFFLTVYMGKNFYPIYLSLCQD